MNFSMSMSSSAVSALYRFGMSKAFVSGSGDTVTASVINEDSNDWEIDLFAGS